MRSIYSLLAFLVTIGLAAQTQGELLTRYDSKREGKHFVYQWNEFQTRESEIDEAEVLAEKVFAQLTDLFGQEHMPTKKLIITFGGEGYNKDTRKKRVPHVDYSGRTHLYRFDAGGYLTPLPHELIHAVRIKERPSWNGFFEEGIASGIAYHLYPKRMGFPRYGFDLDLVAGYWLTSGKGIPISTMVNQHNRLNLKCQLQTYVTREDFFNYLIKTYGVEKLVGLGYAASLGSDEGYRQFFGKSLDGLVADWQADLTKRYNAIDQAESLINDYFNNTVARWMPVCEAGSDF